jgi:hypothetical protein
MALRPQGPKLPERFGSSGARQAREPSLSRDPHAKVVPGLLAERHNPPIPSRPVVPPRSTVVL